MNKINIERKIANFNEFISVFVDAHKDNNKKSFYIKNSDDKIVILHYVNDTEILSINKDDIYSDTEIIDLIEHKQDEILSKAKNFEIMKDSKKLLRAIYTAIYNG